MPLGKAERDNLLGIVKKKFCQFQYIIKIIKIEKALNLVTYKNVSLLQKDPPIGFIEDM